MGGGGGEGLGFVAHIIVSPVRLLTARVWGGGSLLVAHIIVKPVELSCWLPLAGIVEALLCLTAAALTPAVKSPV